MMLLRLGVRPQHAKGMLIPTRHLAAAAAAAPTSDRQHVHQGRFGGAEEEDVNRHGTCRSTQHPVLGYVRRSRLLYAPDQTLFRV